jgi:4-amino-4-deoxy-L-arabinose transferase-like glycosyltransferase
MKYSRWPIIVLLFLLFWEISNPGALRQGTEGFYLKIAQEMSQNHNYLTPFYLNEPHWSKPPLHFWLPQIATIFGIKFSLLTARLSILLFSIGCIYYLSTMLHRLTLKPLNLYFVTFLTSFAFLKYSRIYMMEAPLALLCAVAMISFYEFFEKNKRSSFYISSICAGLTCLIKGPVSLFMIFMAAGIYLTFHFTYSNFKKYTVFVIATLLLASPWFLISFYQYGKDFYYYFFIRENLGKFSSRSYPLSSVFFGFLIYAMPLTFFLPNLFKNFKQLNTNRFLNFTIICFICFFIVWLIPQQRSYHYAIPCIPFYLILILETPISLRYLKYINLSILIISLFLVATCSYFFSNQVEILRVLFTLAFLVCALFILKKQTLTTSLVSCSIMLLTIFNIYLPSFYRPVLPEKVVRFFDSHEAPTVIIKHPYFVEDLINKPVTVIDVRELAQAMTKGPGIFITSGADFNTAKDSAKELARWPVWRRGLKFSEIFNALMHKNTASLEEEYVLFTNDVKYFPDRI